MMNESSFFDPESDEDSQYFDGLEFASILRSYKLINKMQDLYREI